MRGMNRNHHFWKVASRRFATGIAVGILLGQLAQMLTGYLPSSVGILDAYAKTPVRAAAS